MRAAAPKVVVGGPVALKRGKSLIAAVNSPGAVGGYNPEMVRCARSQAADVGGHILIRVPGLTLGCGRVPIVGLRAILAISIRGQAGRIACARVRRTRACDQSCRISYVLRWPLAPQRGKSPIAAVPGTGAVRRYDPEMIRGARS